MGDVLGAVPVVVHVEGGSAASAPTPPHPTIGQLPVTGVELVLVPLALIAVGVGAFLRKAGR